MIGTDLLPHVTRTQRRLVIAGAIAWVCGLEFFLAEAIAAAGWSGYSYLSFDISYLGATSCAFQVGSSIPDLDTTSVLDLCSPRHAWMNGGLVLLGILHFSGVVLTWLAWPRTWLARLALVALGLGALGAILVGAAPVSQRPYILHTIGAVTALVSASAGAMLMGLATLRRAPAFAAFSLVAGGLGLLAALLYALRLYPLLGRGGIERVSAYAEIIWFAVAGVVVLAHALRAARRHPTACG